MIKSTLGNVNTAGASDQLHFDLAVTHMRGANLRKELRLEEITAPEHIAPRSIAFAGNVASSGSVTARTDTFDGLGRMVLMHDPESAGSWGGTFRIVCFAQAPLDTDISIDPFITEVTWSWLLDALAARDARYRSPSGTVTKTLSSGFGGLREHGHAAQIELRASWTPVGENFAAHAEAWSDLICLMAGLPLPEDTAYLGSPLSRAACTASKR